jgi:hypothetical protein
MGREAQCFCRWGASKGSVKAHLETRELIIRGDFRKRILLDQISHISVAKDDLCFKAGGEEVSLSLGARMAEKWAKALTSPPPTLAKKLGIKSESRVYFWGEIDDHELANAVRSSLVKEAQIADLWILRVDEEETLSSFIRRKINKSEGSPALWVVYPKGQKSGLSESVVRRKLLENGFVDTKVAAVSDRLTALRFSRRKTDLPFGQKA